MGICASCLGLNRHSSHGQPTETSRLLDDEQDIYGAVDEQEPETQQDEEDIRGQREALEQISSRAAEDMIDVLHTEYSENGHLTPNLSFLSLRGLQIRHNAAGAAAGSDERTDNEIEQAWLRDVHGHDAENDINVRGSYGGNLVMDLSRLRHNDTQN